MKSAPWIAAASVALMLLDAPILQAKPFEESNVSRWGADYSRFSITTGGSAECSNACARDSSCRAWSYVKAGVEDVLAQCHLKDNVPQGNPDPCCVSGIAAGAFNGAPVAVGPTPKPEGMTGGIATAPPQDILQMPPDPGPLMTPYPAAPSGRP